MAFTRVLLPDALTASLEARRLAAIQLSEEQENFALDERRLSDRASLEAMEQDRRRKALELESEAEHLRLGKLEERLTAYPIAARYDLEWQRLRVAQQLAGNTRAVVSLGASDLVGDLLTAQQAAAAPSRRASPRAMAPSTTGPPRPRPPRPRPRGPRPRAAGPSARASGAAPRADAAAAG